MSTLHKKNFPSPWHALKNDKITFTKALKLNGDALNTKQRPFNIPKAFGDTY